MDFFPRGNSVQCNYSKDDYKYLENYTMFEEFKFYIMKDAWPPVLRVIPWILMWIGFPLTLLAIFALRSLVREDHITPVFVINLLISDFIQICCFVIWVATCNNSMVIYISTFIYYIAVMVSVGFMMCVALERYLVVACPLWYRFRRNIKMSALVSIIVWALCFILFLVAVLMPNLYKVIFCFIFFIFPFPVLIISLVGTLKALLGAISVPLKEKQRIVGTLILVLLNYTVLYSPLVIHHLQVLCTYQDRGGYYGVHLPFLQFSPLADLVLYVFMRKGATDKLLDCLGCCKLAKEEELGQVSTISDKKREDVSSV